MVEATTKAVPREVYAMILLRTATNSVVVPHFTVSPHDPSTATGIGLYYYDNSVLGHASCSA